MTKTTQCSRCQAVVSTAPSRRGLCNSCYYKDYYQRTLEHRKEVGRKYREKNKKRLAKRNKKAHLKYYHLGGGKDRIRASRLWLLYRITPEEYDKIMDFQRAHPIFCLLLGHTAKRDAVEHRHSDGLIRGVMAGMLNRAYGIIERLYPKNTGAVLRALAEFHDNPPASQAIGRTAYGLIGKAQYKKVMRYGPLGETEPVTHD